jgi:hypothetical protein
MMINTFLATVNPHLAMSPIASSNPTKVEAVEFAAEVVAVGSPYCCTSVSNSIFGNVARQWLKNRKNYKNAKKDPKKAL